MSNIDKIFGEILAERKAQDTKWGGSVHDDTHTNFDWIAYLAKHTGKAVQWPFDKQLFRQQMIKVAALAVAAVEWVDRR